MIFVCSLTGEVCNVRYMSLEVSQQPHDHRVDVWVGASMVSRIGIRINYNRYNLQVMPVMSSCTRSVLIDEPIRWIFVAPHFFRHLVFCSMRCWLEILHFPAGHWATCSLDKRKHDWAWLSCIGVGSDFWLWKKKLVGQQIPQEDSIRSTILQ